VKEQLEDVGGAFSIITFAGYEEFKIWSVTPGPNGQELTTLMAGTVIDGKFKSIMERDSGPILDIL